MRLSSMRLRSLKILRNKIADKIESIDLQNVSHQLELFQ